MATWIIDTTHERLHTDDQVPMGRLRERMRRDATRWAKQGLTFEGVTVERDASPSNSEPAYVITGHGYQLHVQQRDGYWPVDALERASVDDWTELPAASP